MKHFVSKVIIVFLMTGCADRTIPVEVSPDAAGLIQVVGCSEYGGISGTWVKCQFRNTSSSTINALRIDVACYIGNVRKSDRRIGSDSPQGEIFEDSLVCGGEDISLVKVYRAD